MRSSLTAAALLVLVVCLGLAVAESEEQFKKMTIKQLRQWMNQRDISFSDISEKSEFVQRAVEWSQRNKKEVRELPKEPFWEVWATIAKDKCTTAVTSKSLGDDGNKVCDAVHGAIDSYFMMHGKRTAAKLKKKPDALTKTANGDVYYSAGVRLLGRLIGHCLSAKNRASCGSASYVTELLEKDKVKGVSFSAWITNVGIENTNPMYEVVNSKSHSDEL